MRYSRKKMAARVRFERTSTKLTVLWITIILPSSFKVAFPTGFEPVTIRLEGESSKSTWATGTLKSTTILYSYIVLSIVFWKLNLTRSKSFYRTGHEAPCPSSEIIYKLPCRLFTIMLLRRLVFAILVHPHQGTLVKSIIRCWVTGWLHGLIIIYSQISCCRSTHSLSTTMPLAIGISFFSIVSLLTSNKN